MKDSWKFKTQKTWGPESLMIGDMLFTREMHEEIVSKPATTGTLSVENIREYFKI